MVLLWVVVGMRWPGFGATKVRDVPPGVIGTARVGRSPETVLRRVGRGDVAILDQVDLDRPTATALVEAGVVGVVNASPSISGRYPNLGPAILTEAGVALVDDTGDTVLRAVKDGATVRMHDGAVHVGDQEIARGFAQTPNTVSELLADARSGLTAQLEAFSANTTEFMNRERGMLLDGVGIPALTSRIEGQHVLVVAPSADRAALATELRALRHFIAEYQPVLIGVGAGADALDAAGHVPSVVLGTATELDPSIARQALDVVVPADVDGHVAGLARLQDMGVAPVAFASSANPEDMALLLAHAQGAALVVAVGFDGTLGGFLDRGRSGSTPSTFLTRLRLGPTLVDSSAVLALYRHKVSSGAVALLLAAALVAAVSGLIATGAGPEMLMVLRRLYDVVAAAVTSFAHRVIALRP